MQRTEKINAKSLFELVEISFSNGVIRFYEAYSAPDKEILEIKSLTEFKKYYNQKSEVYKSFQFGLYYPESKGKFTIDRFDLDPKYCNGSTFKYKTSGWGVIYIQLSIEHPESMIECRIAVNSEKRAKGWKDIYPQMGLPELWDWKIVNSKARKLIYNMKKLAAVELKNKNKAEHGV